MALAVAFFAGWVGASGGSPFAALPPAQLIDARAPVSERWTYTIDREVETFTDGRGKVWSRF